MVPVSQLILPCPVFACQGSSAGDMDFDCGCLFRIALGWALVCLVLLQQAIDFSDDTDTDIYRMIQVVDELKRALVVLAMPHGSIVCTVRIDRERCEEGQVCHQGEVCYYLVA